VERKDSILRHLKSQGSATLSDVAARLGITKQAAQRHLEALRAAGLVSASDERRGRPGRPGRAYRLTEAAAGRFPQGHAQLAGELVDFLEEGQLERFFAARTARIEAGYSARLAGLDLDGRVRELARLATEHGHMTEVLERSDGALALRHCNCPIRDVAARTALPCHHERAMYQRLLGAEVGRGSGQAQGDGDCTYEVSAAGSGDLNV